MFAAAVFNLKPRQLLFITVLLSLLFPLLLLVFDYEKNWDWDSLSYQNFWSLDGMIRHVLFNGFHPVIPWAAFLVFGMWLGRLDLGQPKIRIRLLLVASLSLLLVEFSFSQLRQWLGNGDVWAMKSEEVTFLFSTSMIPPLPQYLVSAGSSALLVIVICLYISQLFAGNRLVTWLCQTGQLSLSIYVGHVIFGLGVIEAMGRLQNQSIEFSLICSALFCVVALGLSVLWLRFFKRGPLESVFRKFVS
ncbi:DUF418 domain-containing protein [Alginatibacterium sediminis]|uniref:DUF418 domain-containing protein n=1 Tax=Alginatibacterium sediminis TaxID=2164068 RepID=UPI001F347EF0|nr:DUF418 domain-containing protein [Alginatibacterium sediminis]